MALTADEVAHFQEHGWVEKRGALPVARIDALRGRLSARIAGVASEYLAGERREFDFWRLMARSRYGLECFWRPGEGEAALAAGREAPEWEPLVMRVGHGLHLVDDLFGALCRDATVAGSLAQLTAPPVKVIQSAVVYKQPRDQLVQFGSHQDAWYLTTEPESLVLAFVTLDDADLDNGCLEVLPGSHRAALARRMTMTDRGFVQTAEGPPADRRLETHPTTPLPTERGTILFVHGRTFHASRPNGSERPRRALIVHAMSAASRFSSDCWIQEPPGGFEVVA